MIPAPEYDTCKTCGRHLRSRLSRHRGYGTLHWAQYVAAHPWLSWHDSPPRLGHVPGEVSEGQEALFPAQTMIPVPAQPPTPTSNEETNDD